MAWASASTEALNNTDALSKFSVNCPDSTAAVRSPVKLVYSESVSVYDVDESGTLTSVTAITEYVVENRDTPAARRRFSAVAIPFTYLTVSDEICIEDAVTLMTALWALLSRIGEVSPPIVMLASNFTIGDVCTDGAKVGCSVGKSEGVIVGYTVGANVGSPGRGVGSADGALEGILVGLQVGVRVGAFVGAFNVGITDGLLVGANVGASVGSLVRAAVGSALGSALGSAEGALESGPSASKLWSDNTKHT